MSREKDSLPVVARAHLSGLEDPVLGYPVKRPLKGLFVVGLEDDPFARSPAPRVHHGVEMFWKLALIVVRVEVGSQINVALRPLQGPEIFADVVRLRIAIDHRRDHKGVIDDFAEAQLFGEIIGTAEQSYRRRSTRQKQLEAAEQHAFRERQ